MALSTSAQRHPDGSRSVRRRGQAGEGRRGEGFRDQAPKSISTIVCLMCEQHATAADGSHP